MRIVSNGDQALAMWTKEPPHLAVIDCNVTGLDAWACWPRCARRPAITRARGPAGARRSGGQGPRPARRRRRLPGPAGPPRGAGRARAARCSCASRLAAPWWLARRSHRRPRWRHRRPPRPLARSRVLRRQGRRGHHDPEPSTPPSPSIASFGGAWCWWTPTSSSATIASSSMSAMIATPSSMRSPRRVSTRSCCPTWWCITTPASTCWSRRRAPRRRNT